MTAIVRIFSWRIILNRFSFDGRHFTSAIYSASKHAGHCPKHAPCAQAVHSRGHVAATYPWDKYPQYFHVCANVVILSLLHVPATRPCCVSLQCVLNKFLSLQHVAATCPCKMTPRVCSPYDEQLCHNS